MKSNLKFFKKSKFLPVDEFFNNVLYDKKIGYYTAKHPFGSEGDFMTAPTISNLFSEMIAIWIISTWEIFGKPKNINIVELGPGDGSLTKVLINVFKRFPKFNAAKKIYLLEISNYLKKVKKKNIKHNNLGKADVTSHVNFDLLHEFFLKNNLEVKKTISQEDFLK